MAGPTNGTVRGKLHLWYLGLTSVLLALQGSLAMEAQHIMSPDSPLLPHTHWRVEVSNTWDVLGPFPIHAREQHFLSPSYPLNLSEPIDFDAKWPSAYADGGEVGWGSAHAVNGTLRVSYPDVRWASLRASEGWAALQHHSVLRTTVTVHPPTGQNFSAEPPQLLIDLQQGSFFAIRPLQTGDLSLEDFVQEWQSGNIYEMNASPPHAVPLPVKSSVTQPTAYDLFVSGDYEIRLFGDPTRWGTDTPTLSIKLNVDIEEPVASVVLAESHNIVPDFIEGWAFGKAIGVGLRSTGDWWTATSVVLVNSADGIDVDLLEEIRIAPGQTRIVPVVISQEEMYTEESLELVVVLQSPSGTQEVSISLKLKHIFEWDETDYQPIVSTYFFATSTPTAFVSIPPKAHAGGIKPPILFLHGAGVNVVATPTWGCEVPRQSHSWIILPTGRTEWGLDWHGPSAEDAWASVVALSTLLERTPQWSSWSFPKDTRVLLAGHSNGGQGTWHIAARYPDSVIAAIPAAAYVKSQAYIPLVQSRSAHFIDPSLRAILETSFTPDDNDLFVSNLVDTPIFAIHGGEDENVPVWHTRALVDTVKTWNKRADITFKEDTGQPHCYETAFANTDVQAFIDRVLDQEALRITKSTHEFTLTVAIPSDSGSLHGFRILELKTPGWLGRLSVTVDEKGAHVTPWNVATFTLQIRAAHLDASLLYVNGQPLTLDGGEDVYVFTEDNGVWMADTTRRDERRVQTSGRASRILSSSGPLLLVIPHKSSEHVHLAGRIAHDLDVYHKLSSEIVDATEALQKLKSGIIGSGNIVTIGGSENLFTGHIMEHSPTSFVLHDKTLTLRGHALPKSSSSIFLHPHPLSPTSLVLVMYSENKHGIERLSRLFPIRTGVTVPDWLVLSEDADLLGAAGVAGAGVWDKDWSWNARMSSF
ncbi:hypothetical protein BDW22DRAFT_1360117 [Trametopsis cervina]|nr:hypothetical protein BDW22DRAFT_1360117 [Trametopsis cervina]